MTEVYRNNEKDCNFSPTNRHRRLNANGGRSCDRPPLRWASIMPFLALLPNDVAQGPSVAASFRFVALRFRFAAWLRHRMAALCRGSRYGAACALPFRRGLSSPQPEPALSVISSRLRVQHGVVTSPCIFRLKWAFPLRRPVDYDVKLSCLAESHQRKITAFACG